MCSSLVKGILPNKLGLLYNWNPTSETPYVVLGGNHRTIAALLLGITHLKFLIIPFQNKLSKEEAIKLGGLDNDQDQTRLGTTIFENLLTIFNIMKG